MFSFYFICKDLSGVQFSSVQLLSRVWPFATPWTAACQAFLYITDSQSILKHMSIKSVMPSNLIILSSPSPSAFNFSQNQGLFQWVSSLHQVAKYWSFSFSIRPYREYSDWFPLGLTGMISLLSEELSGVFCSTTFRCINSSALSHLYGPTLIYVHDYCKTKALSRWTFVGKAISQVF